jgi:hypothetical protein
MNWKAACFSTWKWSSSGRLPEPFPLREALELLPFTVHPVFFRYTLPVSILPAAISIKVRPVCPQQILISRLVYILFNQSVILCYNPGELPDPMEIPVVKQVSKRMEYLAKY